MPIIKKLKRKDRKNNKVAAIVLQNGRHNAIVDLFDGDSSRGARRVDLFEDMDSAVQWVAA